MGRRKGEKKEAIVERERRVWELRCQGYSQPKIGAELGVDHSTVCRILERVRKRVSAKVSESVEARRQEQEALCDVLIDEALAEWHKSKRNTSSVASTKSEPTDEGDGGKPGRETVTRTAEQREGNPVYLDRVIAALERKAALRGLDAPKKREHTGKDGGPIQTQALDYDALWRRPAAADPVEERIAQEAAKAGKPITNGDGNVH